MMNAFQPKFSRCQSCVAAARFTLRLRASYLSIAIALLTTVAWTQEPPTAPENQPVEKPPAASDNAPGAGENPPAAAEQPAESPAASDDLSVAQARLADRYKRLEEVAGRLAELSQSSDPRRAKLLREAIAKSREQDINLRFESIVKLLEDERFSAATTNQTELQKELDEMLALLLKADRDKELASQRDRVRAYLKEVSRLIRMEKGIQARTEGGDDLRAVTKDQQRVAGDTGKLGGNIQQTEVESKEGGSQGEGEGEQGGKQKEKDANKSDDGSKKSGSDQEKKADDESKSGEEKSEGKSGEGKQSEGKSGEGESPKSGDSPSESQPSEGQPGQKSQPGQKGQQGQPGESQPGEEGEQQKQPQDPAQRATNRLQEAQQKMQEALKQLKEAERKGAAERQREALKQLEQAKAELERVLRQLREEEVERTLAQLASRFRKMLELQMAVFEGTVRLDQVPKAERDHDDEIEAARLARQQKLIVNEADKALLLLREEGTSVAFPEAVEQMREDMQLAADRLTAVKVDVITQGLEKDVIAALEETIAALEKALKDMEKNRTPPGQSPPPGEGAEPQLVNKLAELKMIRSLQVRIYNRTQRYGEMIGGEQAETGELIDALKELAERQQRVYQATADLQSGRND